MPEEKKVNMVEELEIKEEEHHYRQKEICKTCSGDKEILTPCKRCTPTHYEYEPCPTCQKDNQ